MFNTSTRHIFIAAIAVLSALLTMVSLPAISRATGYAYSDLFVGEEDFDAYAPGSNLNGYGSVSGWEGPWTTSFYDDYATSSAFSVTSSSPLEGTQSVTATWATTTSGIGLQRAINSHTDGDTISFKIKTNNGETAKDVGVLFHGNNGFYGWYVTLHPWTGQICYGTGGNTLCPLSYSANTVYTIDTQFDYSNNRARFRVDGGAWSSWVTAYNTTTSIDQVVIFIPSGGYGNPITGWWDDFKFSNEPL